MNEPIVNVGILTSQQIKLNILGLYTSPNFPGEFSGEVLVTYENNLITFQSEDYKYSTRKPIELEPDEFYNDTFLVRDVHIGKEFHWERSKDLRFLGSIKLIIQEDQVTLINIVPIETYLLSVVSSEMNANASEEFLKCSAVISRSWLLAQMRSKNELEDQPNLSNNRENEIIRWYNREDHKDFDVCADDHCQRYQGFRNIKINVAAEAVKFTRGLVLMHDLDICDARFSKCCGGITESYENVWDDKQVPYLKGIVDYKFSDEGFDINLESESATTAWIENNPPAFCDIVDEDILEKIMVDFDLKTKNFFRWEVNYSNEEIATLLFEKTGIEFGKIVDLIPIKRGKSGRLVKLKIVGSKETVTFGKELEIRKILSKTHLLSSAFIIIKGETTDGIPKEFTLKGGGWGHGVGLCQIGAAVMGERGYQFDEILLHYYSDAAIVKYY
ncbi:MAG: SpoIID/LytB domain-containing protein [Melioribacteraceae bacterium]|nr:SpoIID/LytB domain-containing protein [Melioribacteraceae bacterium]